MKELRNINDLLMEVNKAEIYSVPAFYFDNLPADILNKIVFNKERASFYGSSNPYSVAPDYFTDFSKIIIQKINSAQSKQNNVFEETESIAPLLNTISKQPVYTTPTDFFNKIELPSAKIKKQKAKIVSIKKRSKYLRLAAAAVIPFLAIGLYTLSNREFMNVRSNSSNARNKVKTLSKEEIVNYLKKNTLFESASSTSENTSADDNNNEIKSSLKQVSDKEIQQFLKETGESDEI